MGLFNRFLGSPDCEDLKNAMEGVLGTWMTFKKPEMDKTLRHGMIETDTLNHKWLDFTI